MFCADNHHPPRPIDRDADADAGDAVGDRCRTQMPGTAEYERLATSAAWNTSKATQPLRESCAGHCASRGVDLQPAGTLAHLKIGGRRGAELLKVV